MTLKVDTLHFAYKDNPVLQDVSFCTETGCITALLGPNGSGKTTLLRCINRVLKPSKGKILLGDRPVSKLSARDIAKSIAYVAQKTQPCNISVFDAILLGRVPHITINVSEEDMTLATNVIDRLDLKHISLRHLNELSGGELQKVSIARALVQKTPLILLDEPTASLDLKNQVDILKLLREISEKDQITVFLSIHDLNTAFRYAHYFLFIKDGKIVASVERRSITPEIIENVYDLPVDIQWFNDIPVVTPKQ